MRSLRSVRALLSVVVAALPLACQQHTAAEPADGASATAPQPVPAPSRPGEGTLRPLGPGERVALNGPRVDAHAGDWVLENAGKVAVVDAKAGTVIDFGTAGGDDALVSIEPLVDSGVDDDDCDVVSVEPADRVLRIERRVTNEPLTLWTFVSFAGETLRIESFVTSREPRPSRGITVGEIVSWGNVPTWVEGTGFVTDGGELSGEFLAREGLGVAYALGREGGRIGARFHKPVAGFDERPHTGEQVRVVAPGETSPRRAVRLAVAGGKTGAAVAALLRAEGAALTPVAVPDDVPRGIVEARRCPGGLAPDGLPFARFDPPGVALPAGCFQVRRTAPGFAPGAWIAAADSAKASAPRAGRLHWHVTDHDGATLPARIALHGIAPTPDPDWGEDPHDGAARAEIHTIGDGEARLPPGRYRAVVSRGFEYTIDERPITVDADGDATIAAKLERAVDTAGWISADLHVHAVPSPDAPTLLTDRVRSLAAAGVEVAVATDHNAVTDYGPTIRDLGVARFVTSIVGDEITTREVELGHFNVFPLAAGGAPIPFTRTTARDIFAATRAAEPRDREKVVQVNHPRMGRIGYFELLHLDEGDVTDWRKDAPLFDGSFDALEVFNGDDYASLGNVERVLRDWYALVDAGLRATATGNSDSHKIAYHDAGVPRNYVRVPNDAPEALDERAFVDAVRRGHVVVSSGPFVRLHVGGAEPGDETAAGEVDASVHVEAPPWVDVSRVQLVRRGEVVEDWTVKPTRAAVRLDATAKITLAPGDWVIAVVRGDAPMTPLERAGAKPFAFTNPVRVPGKRP
jgi:hypothetical protein